jgi:hypothetical protein
VKSKAEHDLLAIVDAGLEDSQFLSGTLQEKITDAMHTQHL